jgi:uncharacterized repeat protein (TIGR01451 family)
MSKFKTKRGIAFTLIAVLSITATAIAYFSSTGSGLSNGSVTSSAPRSVALTKSIDGFTEIGQVKTLTITATNNGGSPTHATIDDVSVSNAAPAGKSCPAGSFTLGTVNSTPQELAANGGSAAIATVSVTFNNVSAVQDDCYPAFTYSSK